MINGLASEAYIYTVEYVEYWKYTRANKMPVSIGVEINDDIYSAIL